MLRSFLARTHLSVGLLSLLLVAAALRLWSIDTHSLWLDEAFSAIAAARPLPEMLEMLRHDSAQPFYHLILHSWIGWGGMTETHLVRLSAIVGLMLVGLVYGIGTADFSRPAGLYAGLLVALSPIHLFYSRQVRMYGLLALVSVAAMVALERACERGRRRDWLGYGVLAVMAMYTHLYGLFVSLIAAVFVWLRRRDRTAVRAALYCHLGILAVYTPWLPSLWYQVSGHHTPHLDRPTLLDVGRSFYYFSFGQPLSVVATPHPIRWMLSLIFSGLLVLGLRTVWRRRPVWVFSLILPLSLGYVMSFITPVYFSGRYDLMVFPVWALLVAAGLTAVKPLILQRVIGLTAIGLTLWPLSLYLRAVAHDAPRNDIADLIVKQGKEGDVVILTGLSRPPIQYYLDKVGQRVIMHSYPRELGQHIGWIDRAQLTAHPDALVRDAEALIAHVEQELRPGGRVWLVYSHPDVSDPLRRQLDARMAMTVAARQGELSYPVFVYLKKPVGGYR